MKFVPVIAAALLLSASPALSHGSRHFAAGEPGNPAKPARTVKISMQEKGKKMLFAPSRVVVNKGEQIRFVLFNDGIENHEFVLATTRENLAHAAAMKQNPRMAHRDPNAISLAPFNGGELLWKFSKSGTFEYGCLIPGHRKAGMYGTVIVE